MDWGDELSVYEFSFLFSCNVDEVSFRSFSRKVEANLILPLFASFQNVPCGFSITFFCLVAELFESVLHFEYRFFCFVYFKDVVCVDVGLPKRFRCYFVSQKLVHEYSVFVVKDDLTFNPLSFAFKFSKVGYELMHLVDGDVASVLFRVFLDDVHFVFEVIHNFLKAFLCFGINFIGVDIFRYSLFGYLDTVCNLRNLFHHFLRGIDFREEFRVSISKLIIKNISLHTFLVIQPDFVYISSAEVSKVRYVLLDVFAYLYRRLSENLFEVLVLRCKFTINLDAVCEHIVKKLFLFRFAKRSIFHLLYCFVHALLNIWTVRILVDVKRFSYRFIRFPNLAALIPLRLLGFFDFRSRLVIKDFGLPVGYAVLGFELIVSMFLRTGPFFLRELPCVSLTWCGFKHIVPAFLCRDVRRFRSNFSFFRDGIRMRDWLRRFFLCIWNRLRLRFLYRNFRCVRYLQIFISFLAVKGFGGCF